MIMIDVLIPPIDKIYDFEISENILLEELIENIRLLVTKKENIKFDESERFLFFYRKGDFLKQNITLKNQGLESGDRLILV